MSRRVYIVDDEDAIRKSLRLMLTVQKYAVTMFGSGAALLDAVDGLPPGCLLLDIRMPGIDGLEVQRRLAERNARLPTVVMTGHGDVSIAIAALRNGALSFLEKPFTRAALNEALDTAFLQLDDPDGYDRHVRGTAARLETLQPVERDVLTHLAAGLANDTIARKLAVDPSAVELTRARILDALAVESLNDVLRIAIRAGYGGDG